MIKPYYKILNFPKRILNDNVNLENFKVTNFQISGIPISFLSHDVIKWLLDHNLEPKSSIMFFRNSKEYNAKVAHIDTTMDQNINETAGINIDLSGITQMSWYYGKDIDKKTNLPDATVLWSLCPRQSKNTVFWKMDKLQKIDEIVFDKSPYLVRVDIPHMVKLFDDQPRLTISIRFKKLESDNSSYVEIIDNLKKSLVF